MVIRTRSVWVCIAAGVLSLAPGGRAIADEALFGDWSTVSEQSLADERGRNVMVDQDGGALAVNIGIQTVENTINGDAYGGTITLMPDALAGQRFVINAFNAGNNVSMLNQLSIAVDLTTPSN